MMRWFDSCEGWYKGTVVSFGDSLYHIKYDDGDEEDLTSRQLNDRRIVQWRIENDFVSEK